MLSIKIEGDYNKLSRKELLTFCDRLDKMAVDGDTIRDVTTEWVVNDRTGNKTGANIFINLLDEKENASS